MADRELLNYIHETSSSGFSHEQIRQTLADAGWLPQEIEEAFADAAGPEGHRAAPHKITLPQDRGFLARHLKALITIFILIIFLPPAAYGTLWGYKKITGSGDSETSLGDATQEETAPPVEAAAKIGKRDGQRLADITALQAALEIYFQTNQIYPKDLATLVATDIIATVPRDPKTGDAYLYSPLGEPALYYSLSFVLENPLGSLKSGLNNVSSEQSISAETAQKIEAAVRGETSQKLLNNLVITDVSALPFYPAEEVTMFISPLAGVEFASAFLIVDDLKLVDRKTPFEFSFSAPRPPGEYPVQVFAFDAAGNGYTATTKLTVKKQ